MQLYSALGHVETIRVIISIKKLTMHAIREWILADNYANCNSSRGFKRTYRATTRKCGPDRAISRS